MVFEVTSSKGSQSCIRTQIIMTYATYLLKCGKTEIQRLKKQCATVYCMYKNMPRNVFRNITQVKMASKVSDMECSCCEDTTATAVGYCQECEEYLCQKCFDVHTVPKPCRSHVLFKLSDNDNTCASTSVISEERAKTKSDLTDEFCKKHKQYKTDFYCIEHDRVCCVYCYMEGHKDCNVKNLTVIKSDYLFSEDVENSLKKLHESKEDTESIQKQIGENYKLSLESERKCELSVEQYVSEIENKISDLKKSMKKKVEEVHLHELALAGQYCESALCNINDTLTNTKAYREQNLPCKLFVQLQRFESIIAKINEDKTGAQKNNIVKTFEFRPSNFFQSCLSDTTLNFGSLEEVVTGCDEYLVR